MVAYGDQVVSVCREKGSHTIAKCCQIDFEYLFFTKCCPIRTWILWRCINRRSPICVVESDGLLALCPYCRYTLSIVEWLHLPPYSALPPPFSQVNPGGSHPIVGPLLYQSHPLQVMSHPSLQHSQEQPPAGVFSYSNWMHLYSALIDAVLS